MKHSNQLQLFGAFLKKIGVALPLLLCLFALAGISTGVQAATLNTHHVAAAPAAAVKVYANHVNVHDINNCPTPGKQCRVVGRINAGTYLAACQKAGQNVSDLGSHSRWWTILTDRNNVISGYVSNVYIKGGEKIAGVPDC